MGIRVIRKDIDVWLACNGENAKHLMEALTAFGFGAVGLSAKDFEKEYRVIQLGYPPRRIALLTSVKGVALEGCCPSREVLEIDGAYLDFIDLENLKKNKKTVGRYQDLADLENLE